MLQSYFHPQRVSLLHCTNANLSNCSLWLVGPSPPDTHHPDLDPGLLGHVPDTAIPTDAVVPVAGPSPTPSSTGIRWFFVDFYQIFDVPERSFQCSTIVFLLKNCSIQKADERTCHEKKKGISSRSWYIDTHCYGCIRAYSANCSIVQTERKTT